MNDRIPPNRAGRSARRCGLCVAVLAAILGCAVAPVASQAQSVDLAPILEVNPDLSHGMTRAFPDYDVLVLGGVQQWNGKPSRDGVVEQVKETYDTVLDESHTWSVDATVTLFDTTESASRDLNDSCYSFAHGGASAQVRSRDGVYCISPVLHVRNEPLRLSQPESVYSSWLIVRNERIVLRLYEHHVGSAKSAKNRIIAEIAERLSKLATPPERPGEFVE
jgi:hypothetical protein